MALLAIATAMLRELDQSFENVNLLVVQQRGCPLATWLSVDLDSFPTDRLAFNREASSPVPSYLLSLIFRIDQFFIQLIWSPYIYFKNDCVKKSSTPFCTPFFNISPEKFEPLQQNIISFTRLPGLLYRGPVFWFFLLHGDLEFERNYRTIFFQLGS